MNKQDLEQILAVAVTAAGFSLFDFQPAVGNRGVLRVFVFRKNRESPLPALDDCSSIARTLLDHPLVDQFIPGDSTLEVSTPGVNRPLKTLEHFKGAIGERIWIKWRPSAPTDDDVHCAAETGEAVIASKNASKDAIDGDTDRFRGKFASVSQVEVGVVTEVLELPKFCSEISGDEDSLVSSLVLVKPERQNNRGRKQQRERTTRSVPDVLLSDSCEDVLRIPLHSLVEAHVDFVFE